MSWSLVLLDRSFTVGHYENAANIQLKQKKLKDDTNKLRRAFKQLGSREEPPPSYRMLTVSPWVGHKENCPHIKSENITRQPVLLGLCRSIGDVEFPLSLQYFITVECATPPTCLGRGVGLL